MTKHSLMWIACLFMITTALLAACGGGNANEDLPSFEPSASGEPTAQPDSNVAAPTVTTHQPEVAATPTAMMPTSLSPEQLQELKPNELGWIPVLQYHHFGPEPDELTRTPEQFLGDLQWLYDNNFYVVNVGEYINDTMDVPAGKLPVMLTFDDSAISQFSLAPLPSGQMAIEADSAVAIMETFFNAHPDFGRGGHFSILPDRAFSWPDAWDQQQYSGDKLTWLVQNGYELGNHTLDHANLAELSTDEIHFQLGEAELYTRDKFIEDARLDIVTLPYGGYPMGGDDTVFKGFYYEGEFFEYFGVLLVGANPAVSTLSEVYDPYAIPRIQAFDAELDYWFEFIEENPGIMYVSDGNPDTVTVPNDLPYELSETLDESKLNGRTLIRY
ncbi:polysaccharide deacetylase family protein [soil metagenome]